MSDVMSILAGGGAQRPLGASAQDGAGGAFAGRAEAAGWRAPWAGGGGILRFLISFQ